MNRKRIFTFLAAGLIVGALGFGVSASAVDGGVGHTGTPPHGTAIAYDAKGYVHVCKNNFPPYEYMNGNLADKCYPGYTAAHLGSDKVAPVAGAQGPIGKTGPAGPVGAAGKDGATGAAGPSGVSATETLMIDPKSGVHTGGSFNDPTTGAVALGATAKLKAGTYLISLNVKVTPHVASTADIFPQFFVYAGAKPDTGFAGNLFNIGAGAIERDVTGHDSYYSGSTLLTLPTDTTLDVYGFGYDSDKGAGLYDVETGTLTAVAITPAPTS